MKKIYLAIPYAFNPAMSFKVANKVAAELMKKGKIVFSPISHSHPIAGDLPRDLLLDHDFWMKMDLPFVEWADEVVVVLIGQMGEDLVEKSKGVQAEIAHAKKLGKLIKFIRCEYSS